MASIRFTDVQARPAEFLDLTSLTLDEFQLLVPPFEAAFHTHMASWRLDGKPRTARRFSVYQNCPLPTPEDRLFFILTYLKTGPDHGVGHFRPFRIMAEVLESLVIFKVRRFCITKKQKRVVDAMIEA